MLAKAALAGGTAFSELDCALGFCPSYLRNEPRSWRVRRQKPQDSLARKSRVLSYRMRDGFLEGTDGEGTVNDCLVPSEGIHEKEGISVLWNLIQHIEPLDLSRVGHDVSLDSKDAMKRTVSGMLGLLPSDRFNVTVEASPEPFTRLLISSVMTGYTLRNAEYRVCLQKTLELPEDGLELQHINEGFEVCIDGNRQETGCIDEDTVSDSSQSYSENLLLEFQFRPESLRSLAPEVESYINQLKSKLSAVTKELEECKSKNTAMDMHTMLGEEKNDLLDYLRSLDTEKVSELSKPSSPEVEEMIRRVVSRCLQTLFALDMHSESPITATRDYLARLLFWFMLFGHHLRGLEYRLELSRTLSFYGDMDLT